MSVNNKKYIVYGISLNEDQVSNISPDADEDWNKYEDWLDDNRISYYNDKKFGFISDDMGGNYFVVGEVLASFDEEDDWADEGVQKLEDVLKISNFDDKNKLEVKKKIDEFAKLDSKPEMLLVNYYG